MELPKEPSQLSFGNVRPPECREAGGELPAELGRVMPEPFRLVLLGADGRRQSAFVTTMSKSGNPAASFTVSSYLACDKRISKSGFSAFSEVSAFLSDAAGSST